MFPMELMYKVEDTGSEIIINFPQKQFDTYLKGVGLANISSISKEHVAKLLRIVLEDYKKGVISLDGLSVICNELWTSYSKKPKIDKKLFGILMNCAELAFEERQSIQTGREVNDILDPLKELVSYLKKYNSEKE
jgi:repressor of nif and glnA expression